ncbi:MAG TPA: prepilin-type N-terminal cleavage/methylation domain-containing protein [bacterium]|nr:prepilin-type N-terminal cleavage/methylation domain-containing protein [bacterium]
MSHFFRRTNQQKGFSLVEMLISMVIFSIVMGIIYTYLLQTKKDIAESEVELNTADNAQTAVNSLRKDLYQIGVGRDSANEQPQLLRAGMYDLIFVADLDRDVRNTDNRYGSIDPTILPPFSSGSPWMPLFFLYDSGIPVDWKYTGYDPDQEYGYKNIGAEIVRYSLDTNSDGRITVQDLEDNIDIETDRTHTFNEQDFWLLKEWWGCIKSGSNYVNQHSGLHPVAFNLRACSTIRMGASARRNWSGSNIPMGSIRNLSSRIGDIFTIPLRQTMIRPMKTGPVNPLSCGVTGAVHTR